MNNDSYYNKVDSDQDLNIRDADSKSRVKLGQAKRDKRNKAKELKAAFKQRLKSLDDTKDKRKLKEQFKSALKDIDTGLDSNRSGAGSTVQDDGIDNVESSTDPLAAAYASQDFFLYAFKVIDDLDGTVSVLTGTVNTETATGLTPSGQPDELWLKVTFSATTGEVTAAVIEIEPSAASETNDSRQIATITWGGAGSNTPTIVQGIKGSQSIASCGETHQWGTLYS
jgi:hypothetical protein